MNAHASTRLSLPTRLGQRSIVAAVSRCAHIRRHQVPIEQLCWGDQPASDAIGLLAPDRGQTPRGGRHGDVILRVQGVIALLPACTMTFASDWPWRMTYRSNGMPMVAPPELVDCRTDIDRVRTGRADPFRFHRSRNNGTTGHVFAMGLYRDSPEAHAAFTFGTATAPTTMAGSHARMPDGAEHRGDGYSGQMPAWALALRYSRGVTPIWSLNTLPK